MKQDAIKVPAPTDDSRSLHEIILGILREFGPRKQEHLVAQLGASKGHVSEVLSGDKNWPLVWLDYIVEHYDFRNEVAQHFARLRRMEVRPPRVKPPAERLRRLSYVLGKHNGIGKALLDEAEALPDDVFADEEETGERMERKP